MRSTDASDASASSNPATSTTSSAPNPSPAPNPSSTSRPRQYKQVAPRYRTTATTTTPAATPHPQTAPSEPTPTTLGLHHPAPTASPQPSDVDWERAMDARLAQWRYINLVAVAELQAEEAAACAGINAAAARLEAAMDDVAELTARLDAARAAAVGPTFAARARPPLAALVAALTAMRPAHARCCARLVDALHALPTRNIVADPGAAAALAREVARFRVAAAEFAEVAAAMGAEEKLAEALEDLARVVAEEAPGVRRVLCATVEEAARCLEEETRERAVEVAGKRKARGKRGGKGGGDGGDAEKGRKRGFASRALPAPVVQRMAAVTAGLG